MVGELIDCLVFEINSGVWRNLVGIVLFYWEDLNVWKYVW